MTFNIRKAALTMAACAMLIAPYAANAQSTHDEQQQLIAQIQTDKRAIVLKTMALAGRGVAWLPASLVADELASGALVPAGDERWRVPVEIRLDRQSAEMASTAEELWRVVGGAEKHA